MNNSDTRTDVGKEFEDQIINEVRQARQAYAVRFDYDVERMLVDLERKAARHPERWSDVKPVIPAVVSARQ